MLEKFLSLVSSYGARAFLIGGAVIDTLYNRPVKDWDVEVYNISMDSLESLLKGLNLPCDMVGKSFGVIKTKMDGIEFDISIPRTENKIGVGHKGFNVELNPKLTPMEAGRRRDLTINSMYKDLHTGKLVDPFDGLKDLKDGRIKVTDQYTFVEDPLRVLRIMQLLPRKGKFVDPLTIDLCKSMIHSFKELPKERIFEEFAKLLMKADKPSMGLDFLKECGWLVHFPELNNLINCPQNPEWHPEGDVWIHTLMVIDNAAKLRGFVPEEYRLAFMFAALLHDVGKPSTTVLPLCTAHGHDKAGIPLAKTFMERMTTDKNLLEYVPKLVGLHMMAGQLNRSEAKLPAWKRLHRKFRLDILGWLSKADNAGRTGRNVLKDEHPVSERCFEFHKEFGNEIKPIIMGRDLIALGMEPGKHFGPILEKCMELQMEGLNKQQIISTL